MSLPVGVSRRPRVARWNISAKEDVTALDFYRSGIAEWYEVSGFDEAESPGFFTQNTVCQFGDYSFGRGRSIGQTLSRGPAQIRRSGLDGVCILLDLAGMVGEVGGVDVDAPPGTIHFRDLARPSRARVGAVDAIVLAMPREAAPAWLVERPFHGLSISSSQGIGRLLCNHLMAFAEAAPQMSADDGIASVEAALLLSERALVNSGRFNPDQTRAVYRSLRASAVAIIDRGLHDPSMGVDRLTRELGVSRATLFRAFSETKGINGYVKRRRLQKARSAILKRVGHRPSIAEIAHACGFVSESHFSRSFRELYGVPPGSVLVNATAPDASVEGEMRYDLVLGWMRGE